MSENKRTLESFEFFQSKYLHTWSTALQEKNFFILLKCYYSEKSCVSTPAPGHKEVTATKLISIMETRTLQIILTATSSEQPADEREIYIWKQVGSRVDCHLRLLVLIRLLN